MQNAWTARFNEVDLFSGFVCYNSAYMYVLHVSNFLTRLLSISAAYERALKPLVTSVTLFHEISTIKQTKKSNKIMQECVQVIKMIRTL